MNQREEARGHEQNERDRESNNGRDFYPGGHGFEDMGERANRAQGSYGRDQWRQRAPWANERSPWNDRARSREASAGQGHFPRDLYGREHSSEQLFDRPPFGHVEDTHYYGTGAAGWGGPGFTGGAYAYGNGPREQQRQIEEEYSDESAVSYEHGSRPGYDTRGRYH